MLVVFPLHFRNKYYRYVGSTLKCSTNLLYDNITIESNTFKTLFYRLFTIYFEGLVISAEILIGLVFGSLGLISFTIITTVCIIMKLRVPLEKTISATPIKTVKSNTPIRTISNKHYSHTKPIIMNGKPVKNGVSRRIVAW